MEGKPILNDGYVIYEDGRLYSNLTNQFLAGGIIATRKSRKGYLAYCLQGKTYYAHRLVAENFITNPNFLPQINHIDGNSFNNNVDNLEWCTASRNVKHSYDIGLHVQTKCKVCGKLHYSLSDICVHCKVQRKDNEIFEQVRKEKRQRLYGEFINTDFTNIPEKYRNVILMRQNGYTFQEIADRHSVSRQDVQYLTRKYR